MHRAPADLALLLARRQQLAGVDPGGQRGVVPEDAVHAKHVRDQVVGEDRQAVEVENSATPASARSFGAIWARFQKPRSSKKGIRRREHRREPLGRATRLRDDIERPPLAEEAAKVAQRLGVQRHQLVVRLLPEHRSHLGPVNARSSERPRTRGAPRSASEAATVKYPDSPLASAASETTPIQS